MTQEHVFAAAHAVVLPCWVLLLVAPRARVTARVVHAPWAPLLVGLLYLWALGSDSDPPAGAGFHSLAAVTALLSTSHAMLVVWLHFLVVDLMVGAWIARDAARLGVAHRWVAPALLLTCALAPLGLLVWCVVRFAKARAMTLAEAPAAC